MGTAAKRQRAKAVDANAELAAARAAFETGDLPATLHALLVAWRAVRDPDVADLIDLVGARAARTAARPAGATREKLDAAWDALAAAGDPVVRDNLYATVLETSDPVKRLRTLLAYDDPRSTRAIADLLARGGSFRYYHGTWKPLLAALVRDPDVRVATRQGEILAMWRRGAETYGERMKLADIEARVAAIVAACAEPHPRVSARAILDDLHTKVTAIEPGDATREAALFSAVYAEPANDDVRAVLADWLLQRGDARGELIALQLAPDSARGDAKIGKLLAAHRSTWLGSLAAAVHESSVEWERGFPAHVEVREGVILRSGDPAWRTIESISRQIPATDAHPMPLLRRAKEIGADAVRKLAALSEPPPLEILALADDGAPQVVAALARLRLPALRRLDFDTPPVDPAALATLVAIGPIVEMRIPVAVAAFERWLAALAKVPRKAPLECLHLNASASKLFGPALRCARDVQGRFTRVDVGKLSRSEAEELLVALETLPAGALTAWSFPKPKDVWLTPAQRGRMTAALARHPGIVVRLRS